LTIISTEVINYSGLSPSNLTALVNRFVAQKLPVVTLRLSGMYYYDSDYGPGSAERAKCKDLINALVPKNIRVSLDSHTWYSTWDQRFDDSVSGNVNNRTAYKNWLKTLITEFETYPVERWMVLNEPQSQQASSGENQFILDVISAAKSVTSKPVSVRFMGGANPSTNHYADSIDAATDFLCRNMYWVEAQNTYWDPAFGGSGGSIMLSSINAAHALGKEIWVTEFGRQKNNNNTEDQRASVARQRDWFNANGVDRAYCWALQPNSTGEDFNIFSGMTPNPAFYELTNGALHALTVDSDPAGVTFKVNRI
jgi:hypothetical protein